MKSITFIKALFFDLDGTLFDTAPDLTFAMNQVLKKHGQPPVNEQAFRLSIYAGTHSMLQYAFNITLDDPNFLALKKEFLETYHQCSTNNTCFFEGMGDVLAFLDDHHILWGIVTNKPYWLSEPLLKHFGIEKRAQCLIGGDTLTRRKPHPEPLLKACELVQISPKFSAYVGDTETDIIAANAAGMYSLGVTYGYAPKESNPKHWGADALIHYPSDLIDWLKKSSV